MHAFAAGVAGACSLMSAPVASACSVCLGDPQSPLSHGAAAGVMVLVGVTAFVLMGMVGTGFFWMYRSRKLSKSAPGALDITGPIAH